MFNPLLSKYIIKQASQILPVKEVKAVGDTKETTPVVWHNHFKDMLKNNEAVILGVVPRTMNAKDLDGNGLIQAGEQSGNFINAIERLDEIKAMGINTLHILPIHPTGKTLAMGTAGSLYAPDKFIEDDGKLAIDPNLKDPNTQGSAWDHFKIFIDECHKRGISVMLDLPSCASLDFAKKHPELMAKEKDGQDKTPQGWQDIRMFRVWDDEGKRILNPKLVDIHRQYVNACIELCIDVIRADVSRAKPIEFWNVIIPYSHMKDPQFGWLAESYTHEDASPQLNMPYDRPEDQLRGGFDSYYGQFHILHQCCQLLGSTAERIEQPVQIGFLPYRFRKTDVDFSTWLITPFQFFLNINGACLQEPVDYREHVLDAGSFLQLRKTLLGVTAQRVQYKLVSFRKRRIGFKVGIVDHQCLAFQLHA